MSAPVATVRPMRCPVCGNEDMFVLTLPLRIRVEGTTAVLDARDIDWDATGWVTCGDCGTLDEDGTCMEEWEMHHSD